MNLEDQVKEVTLKGLNEAKTLGIQTGSHETTYMGEKVTIQLANNILKTAYGNHSYTMEQLIQSTK